MEMISTTHTRRVCQVYQKHYHTSSFFWEITSFWEGLYWPSRGRKTLSMDWKSYQRMF